MTQKEVKKSTLGKTISWIFGIILILAGLGAFISSSFVAGLTLLIMSAVLLPPVHKMFKDKMNFELSKKVKWTVIIIGIIIVGFTANTETPTKESSSGVNKIKIDLSTTQKTITKSVSEMLPSRQDIPTEFKMDAPSNFTPSQMPDGFDSGIKTSATKIVGSTGTGIIVADFNIIKFKSNEQARNYHNSDTNRIRNEGGYTDISLSVSSGAECFSFTEDYGYQGRFATSDCVKDNLAYQVIITATQTFEKPQKYLKDMITLLDNKINK